MRGKAKRANKKSDPSVTAEQHMMFAPADPESAKSTVPMELAVQERTTHEVRTNETISGEKQQSVVDTDVPSLPNEGTLLVNATCAPSDVAYPTDLNLLNEAWEKLEAIIDTLYEPVIGQVAKPRTYREKARRQYLAVSKKRPPGPKVIRKAIRRQLGFVGRNLEIITEQARAAAHTA